MISTSVSKDLFQRYVRPTASDRELLRWLACAAVAGGALGVLLSVYLSTIVQAMTVFYSLLGVSLFVPVLGGLYLDAALVRPRPSRPSWRASSAARGTLRGCRTYPWLDPTVTRGHGRGPLACCYGRDVIQTINMKTYRIAVIAGDGIGKEVVPAGIDVLNLAAEHGGFRCEFTPIPWGCDYYLQHGRMMDDDGIDRLMKFDAIYLGAIGDPQSGRSHLGPRVDPAVASATRAVGQPPSYASAAGHLVTAGRARRCRHRHDLRARKLGGGVLRDRRTAAPRHSRRKWLSRPVSSRATASSVSHATPSSWRPHVRAGCWRALRSRMRCSTRW